jgi:hypothetical protein
MTTMCGSGASCLREMQWHRLKMAMHYHLGTDLGLARSLARRGSARVAGLRGTWAAGRPGRRRLAREKGRNGRERKARGRGKGTNGRARGDEWPRERGRMAAREGTNGRAKGAESPQGCALVVGPHLVRGHAPPLQNLRPLVPATILITSLSLRVIE